MALNIGENIKKLRAEKGVTQEQLAEHLSITYQSVSKWENAVTAPDLYLIPAIAEYFEVSIDELFLPGIKGYKNKAARRNALYHHRHTKENFDKAELEYEKLISENKADAVDMAAYGCTVQFRAQDLNKKAEELMKKAIDMGNNSEGQLIYLLASQGRQKENIAKYEEALNRDPNNPRNWYLLAYSYGGHYGDGINPEKALEICQKGLEKFPNDSGLLDESGNLLRGLKKYDEAIQCYKKAIAQEPHMGGSYYGLAFVYTDAGKYQEAIRAWEEVIALNERVLSTAEEIEMATEWPKKEIAKLQTMLDKQND